MAVLQHYYTSFVNKETGSAGFQVKAMSPGISPDMQSIISRLIAYRIPPTLNEYAIETHPIALRYYYKDPHESILLCSQSNGNDENGRPGNFFAHTLVMEPDVFTTVPPILYWRSSIWRTRDPGNRTQLAPLPNFDEDPSMDIEKVWEFLAQGLRRKHFYKLMSAVVHSTTTQRRIVIIDSADNVALWIAAVSCMLPPPYRPLLSFATYHHDPYQAQFMITGTTSDSSFHATPEEYMSFFIFTETGMMSEVEGSPYARMAVGATRPDLYEEQLLPLFAMSMRRFPLPTRIDEQLDLVAQYFALTRLPRQEPLTVPELQAARLALTGFEQLSSYDEDDVDDLRRLARALSASFKTQRNDDDFVREYRRVVQLQKTHKIATEEYLLNELSDVTELLMSGNASIVASIEELKQAHGEQLFVKVVNSAAYSQYLTQFTEHANPSQLQLIWEHLGRDIRPDSQSQNLLLTSLHMVDGLWRNRPKEEGAALANAMKEAMAEQMHEWLKLAVNINASLPDGVLRRFYYVLVSKLPLDERLPYRDIVASACTDIVWQELKYDMRNTDPRQGVATLEMWVRHAKLLQYQPDSIVQQGLNALRSHCTPEEWRMLAPKILTNPVLTPLPWELEASLAKISLSSLSLSRFTSAEVELCKRYRNNSGLPQEIRMVMDGILAMLSGQLDRDLAKLLHEHFERVSSPMVYQAEVEKFMTEFFKAPHIEPDAHSLMVWALHTSIYNDIFWQSYWRVFADMLTTPSRAERATDVLALWFDLPPAQPRMRYVAQSFFFMLPQTIEDVRRVHGFFETARKINACAEQYQWYTLVQPFFSERKNLLTSIGQNLALRFQRRNLHSEEAEAQALAQKQAFDAKVAGLFERKQIKTSHTHHLPALYSLQQREQFWSAYWEGFSSMLVSRDADYALELLSFWFDDSFEALEYVPQVVHDFFLSLREVLEVVRKERGFAETAQLIYPRVAQQRSLWHPLVKNFFSVQEKGQLGISWLKRG